VQERLANNNQKSHMVLVSRFHATPSIMKNVSGKLMMKVLIQWDLEKKQKKKK